jgi:AraC family transcriptional regulator of adaptative response/methylated-DNA-[protein]-cysteine methyltransferase
MKTPELVKYGTFATDFGYCRLAMSLKGICFLGFFETPAGNRETLARLKRLRPADRLAEDHAGLEQSARLIFRRPAAKRLPEGLVLDLCGTPFQLAVWQALRTIPPGETRSYREIAAAAGRPAAIRAAANAVAANPVAWLVPCHRVIRADGSLGGYRWGPACKKAMLAWERNFSTAS